MIRCMCVISEFIWPRVMCGRSDFMTEGIKKRKGRREAEEYLDLKPKIPIPQCPFSGDGNGLPYYDLCKGEVGF